MIYRAVANTLSKKLIHVFPNHRIETPKYTLQAGKQERSQLTWRIKTRRALWALIRRDKLKIFEAYARKEMEIDGDLFSVLDAFLQDTKVTSSWFLTLLRDNPLLRWAYNTTLYRVIGTKDHYGKNPSFYRAFLPDKYPLYSHGIYLNQKQTLDEASENMLQYGFNACCMNSGDYVLDIGSGWGSFTKFATERDINVVGLTLQNEHKKYVEENLERRNSCSYEIRVEDFYKHKGKKLYDAIVNFGVTEHLTDYDKAMEQYSQLIKPGGYIFCTFSAFGTSMRVPSFTRKYIYPQGLFGDLPRFLEAIRASRTLEVVNVINDRLNYEYTLRDWALKFMKNKKEIVPLVGEFTYRIWLLWLTGASVTMRHGLLSGYRVLIQKKRL